MHESFINDERKTLTEKLELLEKNALLNWKISGQKICSCE